jgi:hypothetical protein
MTYEVCLRNMKATVIESFRNVVLDAALQDYGLAPAFLLGLDLRALCTNEEVAIVHAFLDAMDVFRSG